MRNFLVRLLTYVCGRHCASDIACLLKVLRRAPSLLTRRQREECRVPSISLAIEDKHVFFGYYDLCPFHPTDNLHLALVTSSSAGPSSSGPAQVGYFDLTHSRRFHPIGKTELWNWQMGCRLQWYPRAGSYAVIFNAIEKGLPSAVIRNAEDGSLLHSVPIPIYDIAPNGKEGLCLDFFKLQRQRPGYGYVGANWDRSSGVAVWRVDIDSRNTEPLVIMDDVLRTNPRPSFADSQHYINHLSYSPDGAHFMFLHLWTTDNKRNVRLMTANADGTDLRVTVECDVVSHYAWVDARRLLCFSGKSASGLGYYIYDLDGTDCVQLGRGILAEDGHPSYFPGRKKIITDTYPDCMAERHLLCYSEGAGAITKIATYYSPFSMRGEMRCDLHPRLDKGGGRVSVDTGHSGRREIRVLQLGNGAILGTDCS